MDKFGIKATIYDLLGYILPGAFFIAGMFCTLKDISLMYLLSNIKSISSQNISISFSISFLAVSYCTGLLLATTGSLLFENKALKSILNRFYNIDNRIFDQYTIKAYGKAFSDCDFRIITSFCQTKYPSVYDTALIFLSIYGFARNMSVVVSGVLIIHVIKFGLLHWSHLILFFIFLLFFHSYARFNKYYISQIASSLSLT
jgi:hypothetical protein